MEVAQEQSTTFGIMDMVCNNVIYEHKIKTSKVEDVLQCFKYLMATEYKKAELWAPDHSDKSLEMVKELNKLFDDSGRDKEISLKKLNDTLTNPSLTEAEKEII